VSRLMAFNAVGSNSVPRDSIGVSPPGSGSPGFLQLAVFLFDIFVRGDEAGKYATTTVRQQRGDAAMVLRLGGQFVNGISFLDPGGCRKIGWLRTSRFGT